MDDAAGNDAAGDAAGWGARLAAVLPTVSVVEGAAPVVAAIGARAARVLDDAATARVHESATTGDAQAFRGPRFASLADAGRARPDARAAEVALLTTDALDGAATRVGRVPDDVLGRGLGVACRLYPARLLLFVQADETPVPETLFAFGFRRVIVAGDGEVHEYCLRDYKLPPDWLNARFWANPERFAIDPDDETGGDGAGDDGGDDEDDDEYEDEEYGEDDEDDAEEGR